MIDPTAEICTFAAAVNPRDIAAVRAMSLPAAAADSTVIDRDNLAPAATYNRLGAAQ